MKVIRRKQSEHSDNVHSAQEVAPLKRPNGPIRSLALGPRLLNMKGENRGIWELTHCLPFLLLHLFLSPMRPYQTFIITSFFFFYLN